MVKKILAIDYGDSKIGTAYNDDLGITIQPYKTIFTKGSDRKAISEIKEIIKEKNIKKIVIGMPYNEDGTVGERAEKTKKFIKKLHNNLLYSGYDYIEIETHDERYTSIKADETLKELNINQKKGKKIQDTLAAYYILKSYLDK